jgi:basic membrane protein A
VKKTLTLVGALISAAALTLTSCAEPPGTSTETAAPTATGSATTGGGEAFKACMVSDSGGFDDKSFNQTSYKGLTDAKA